MRSPVRTLSSTKRGFTFLWDSASLAKFALPNEVVSLREFVLLSSNWPEELPSQEGNSLVVAGLEGVLDCLSFEESEVWLDQVIKPKILGFQDRFEGEAGLVFWLPGGKQRIQMNRASETYFWLPAGAAQGAKLEIGRILCGGAQTDIQRVLISQEKSPDIDGPAWVGIHLQRIS